MNKFLLYFLFISLIVIGACNNEKQLPVSEKIEEIPEPKFEYGICIDSLVVIKDQVKKKRIPC